MPVIGAASSPFIPLNAMPTTEPTPAGSPNTPVDSRYYLAVVAGAGWLIGIGLASLAPLGVLYWLLAAGAALVAAIAFWRVGRVGLALAGLAALALGGARYVAATPPADPGRIDFYAGATGVKLAGRVAAEPELGDTRARLRVAAAELVMDGRVLPVAGDILVETRRYPIIGYGASLRLTGDLEALDALDNADYAAYLGRQGIRAIMRFPEVAVVAGEGGSPLYRAMLAARERGRAVIRAALPEPQAALLTGILLGDDSGLPDTTADAFQATGMTHIIAISGFNIVIIIGLLDWLTGAFLPRRPATLIVMLLLILYAVLVGAAPSVVRATVMGITYLLGLRLLGRRTLAVAGLFVAAALMTLFDPLALWSVGFQLSFAATLGLMLYASAWTRRIERGAEALLTPRAQPAVKRLLGEGLTVTLAAQVLTVPLLLYHFGRLSLASLPANLLALPAQPGVMLTGGLALLAGLIHPAAGRIAALPAWLFLTYTVGVIHWLARAPGASIPLALSPGGLLAVYAAIAGLTLLAALPRERRRDLLGRVHIGRRAGVALGVVAVLALLGLFWLRERPDGRLHVAFLDVGQGDAILIQTPAGRQVLVDGGRYPSRLLEELGEQMPFWDRSLDVVIATHPDADHADGLISAVERYDVAQLVTNGADGDDDAAFGALLLAAATDGAIHVAQAGETLDLGDGARLEILQVGAPGAEEGNDASIVARLVYGDLAVLLTGDAAEAAEAALLAGGRPLAATVLKAGHHGANTSCGADFLRVVAPQVVVISVGADNSYGHPAPAMLQRVAAQGATVLRTDEVGTIELVSDGRQMWWETERLVAEP
ncbi:DNA internalization-related competence protein ComEC/Rec2 [Promineifilum sp.]|uniref:DNA internalization-related competence protein ComEC/Rec2 n=1 Tax=Promineifilum sp. TaxID=2664178 RepID=UPI0035AFC6DC